MQWLPYEGSGATLDCTDGSNEGTGTTRNCTDGAKMDLVRLYTELASLQFLVPLYFVMVPMITFGTNSLCT